METRANYVAVGLLTLLALAGSFLFVWWIGNYGGQQNSKPLEVVIRGSVSGLSIGSPVQFNGVPVGRVTGLALDEKEPGQVIVATSVRSDVPLRADTRASVGMRGLAGGAYVQLEGGSNGATKLLQVTDPNGPPRLVGDPSSINELINRVNGIASQTERVMGGLEKLVEQNSDSVSATIKNAETFSAALSRNSDGVDRFLKSADSLATTMQSLSGGLETTIARVEAIVEAVEPKTIGKTIDDLSATAEGARKVVEGVDPKSIETLVANLSSAAERLKGVMEGMEDGALGEAVAKITSLAERADKIAAAIEPEKVAQTVDDISKTASATRKLVSGIDENALSGLISELSNASGKVSALMAAIDTDKVNNAVDQISATAKGAQTIVEDVSKVTSRFGNRAEDIDQMVTDASQLAARLNESSKKLDGVLDGINGLLGSGETSGLFADARATLAEFRKTARNLNAQVAGVAAGINKFTGRGLADTQGLISDARQSLRRLDRVIRNFQDNPSSLITGSGGSSIKERGAGRPRR